MERIAHVTLHGDPLEPLGSIEAGGQNVYVKNIATHLARRGVQVDVFTRWNTPEKARIEEIAPGSRSVRLRGGPRSFVKKERLLEFMDEMLNDFHEFTREEGLQYDLVHTHYYVEGAFGMRLCRELQVPQFHTFHSLGKVKLNHEQLQGLASASDYVDRLQIESQLMETADVLVATSPHEAQDFSEWYGHNNRNTTIVPCGLDPGLFRCKGRTRAREELKLPQNKRIALYVGRLDPRKGLETLMYAYRSLLFEMKSEQEKVLLVVVGGNLDPAACDEELKQFRQMAATLQIPEWNGSRGNILFSGCHPQPIVSKFYSAADFTVVPSYYEPFGMVAIETQACGTPAIVSAVGGLRYAVEDECGGLHARPYSPADLAEKMLRMVKDEAFCRSMGRQGRQRVMQKFTWNAVTDELISEYESTLTKKHRRAANVISMQGTNLSPVTRLGTRLNNASSRVSASRPTQF